LNFSLVYISIKLLYIFWIEEHSFV